MEIFDVIIIGGGVTGTTIARELSFYKLRVGLLEKAAELAFGVSKSNSGIIHPGTQNPPDSLKGRLCVQGNKLIRKIARDLGVHFQEVGELIVIFKEADLPELIRLKAEGEKLGVKKLKIVDQKWLQQHEPNLNREAIAALCAPTAGIISPYRLVYDLAENAKANGVEIFLDTEVVSITPTKKYFEITTTSVKYYAKHLINAAGLYADEIARMVGIEDIEIKPRKGEEYLLDKKREHIVNHILFPLPSPNSKGVLVIKTSDGNPMIGPTAEDIQDKSDLTTTAGGLQKVLASVKQLVPSISEQDIIAYFAGLRPVAGKDFIIRRENKVPGLITVAGIQSPGLTAAPAIALLVKDLLRKSGLNLTKKKRVIKYRKPSTHLFAIPFSKTKQLIGENPAYGDIVCRCEMVSAQEIREAIRRGASTLDGIKFRTRAQAGRCHGGFCTTRIMKIMAEELKIPLTEITKRGKDSEIVKPHLLTPTLFPSPRISEERERGRPKGGSEGEARDLVIVGGGPAGMAAAISAYENGCRDILLLERDQFLGGILNQCIHPGFGLHYFKDELTGTEYAERFITKITNIPEIAISLKTLVVNIAPNPIPSPACGGREQGKGAFIITYLKPGNLVQLKAKAIIMATGCREKTREMVHIPGTRPAGVFPAGLAQKLINIEGLLPGKEVVIIGSGDIGLIMARRFTLEGAKVKAVLEIQPQTRGLVRNVVQCLEDFDIPLYFNHQVTQIHGQDRVTGITAKDIVTGKEFELSCDTVLISVGLIPERDLVDSLGAIPGLFFCGNADHVYDLVDNVTVDSIKTGKTAAEYLK